MIDKLYIADIDYNRIRKFNTGVIITTIASNQSYSSSGDGGKAASAQLNHPIGIAIDSSRNLYIADKDNNRIRMMTTP